MAAQDMAAQDIVVIGGSAGALEALAQILKGLPRGMEAAVFVVLHTAPQGSGALAQILARSSELPVEFAEDGKEVRRSHVYVAPPDHHLTLDGRAMRVARGPRENGFRPAIDPLFRSAAKEYGGRVVGVILSGALDDGTFGLMAIKQAGGMAIVQHPYEAFVPSMPLNAIQNVEVDQIVRSTEIAGLLIEASQTGLKASRAAIEKRHPPAVPDVGGQRDISLDMKRPDDFEHAPSAVVCPECGGALWELTEGNQSRYRCHTGHGFTMETLLAGQNGKLEGALWSAVRVLMERSALHRQLAERTEKRGMHLAAQRHGERASVEEKNAELIRQMLAKRGPVSLGSEGAVDAGA